MASAMGAIVIPLVTVVLVSCAHAPAPSPAAARTARLYPANDPARPGGELAVQFTDDGSGHGTMEFTLPYGEPVKGEYSEVVGSPVGFGSIYRAVFGPTRATTTSSSVAPRGNPGTVSAFGAQGTRVNCELYRDRASGHGSGGCQTSTGFLYRLQY